MKIPMVGPDVEQAVEHTLRLTFLHNFIPIGLALACLGSLIYLILKPSRLRIFLLIGFGLLLLHFEYMKHILEPLTNQTMVTLTTDQHNYGFEWLTSKILTKGVPIILLMGGWGSLIGCGVYFFMKRRKS
jgi:hypothetical protein